MILYAVRIHNNKPREKVSYREQIVVDPVKIFSSHLVSSPCDSWLLFVTRRACTHADPKKFGDAGARPLGMNPCA